MKKIGLFAIVLISGCSHSKPAATKVADDLSWCCENQTCRYQPDCNQIPGQENCAGTCHLTRGDCYTDTDCTPE